MLFNFESGNFPYGGGLVRVDVDSNVLWALGRNTHHDMDVAEDGIIYVAAHNYNDESPDDSIIYKASFLEDVLLNVSPDGDVVEQISILDALQNSVYRNLLAIGYNSKPSEDPMHLDTVEILSRNIADSFPMFEPGDILISLRNLDMIGMIDAEERIVKWALVGMFAQQHDPDFLANGNIMLFDNWGGQPYRKRSRILEIDPVTQEVEWQYEGSAEGRFFSSIRGKQQVLPNGNVLITDAQHGRVLEVTREQTPEIVWEYYNRLPPVDGQGRVGLVTMALRLGAEAARFLN